MQNRWDASSISFLSISAKHYDNVPRKTLFNILKSLGCGKRFLSALMSIYKNTINILNSEYIRATIGVKQGGPMSCLLFIIYLNVMVLMMKVLGDDSFLADLHLIVLIALLSWEVLLKFMGPILCHWRDHLDYPS